MTDRPKRTNPEKLQVKYPVVEKIKKRLRRNPDVKEHQVANFDRRFRSDPFLLQILEYTQELSDKLKDKESGGEIKRLADTCRYQKESVKNQQEEIDRLKAKIEELELELDNYKCYDKNM